MKLLKAFYRLVETAGDSLAELRKIRMKISELGPKLGELGDQLTKALDEIRAAIEKQGDVPPEVEAALTRAKDVAQQLDDLNPDTPPPGP